MIDTRKEVRETTYSELESDLRSMIDKNQLGQGVAITPESELARRYGISRNTARKALAKLESEGLLRKIQGKGTFIVPIEERQQNASSKPSVLLAIMDYKNMNDANAYDRNLISGCIEEAYMEKVDISVTDPDSLSEEKTLKAFRSSEINAIIWERPAKEFYPLIEALRKNGVPQVTISRSLPGVPSIFFDSDKSIEEAVAFLAAIGHRNIAMVDLKKDYPIFTTRQRVFVEAVRKMGAESPEKNLCLMEYGADYDKKFNELPLVTAAIVSSVLMDSFHAWAQRRGLSTPMDMSLISISSENSLELERHPEISAILDPRREIGRLAMRTVLSVAKGESVPEAPQKIKGDLVVRRSCASPCAAG